MLMMKNIKEKWRSHALFMLTAAILTQWQRPVPSSEALDLLYWAICAVLYRRTAVAIKMASKVCVFVDCCLFACCPGSRWSDTKQVVARWQHPVASKVTLDILHWGIPSVLPRSTAVAINMANGGGAFVRHQQFCQRHMFGHLTK
jgi:hypothetical protein